MVWGIGLLGQRRYSFHDSGVRKSMFENARWFKMHVAVDCLSCGSQDAVDKTAIKESVLNVKNFNRVPTVNEQRRTTLLNSFQFERVSVFSKMQVFQSFSRWRYIRGVLNMISSYRKSHMITERMRSCQTSRLFFFKRKEGVSAKYGTEVLRSSWARRSGDKCQCLLTITFSHTTNFTSSRRLRESNEAWMW